MMAESSHHQAAIIDVVERESNLGGK